MLNFPEYLVYCYTAYLQSRDVSGKANNLGKAKFSKRLKEHFIDEIKDGRLNIVILSKVYFKGIKLKTN